MASVIVWSASLESKVFARMPDGKIRTLASGLEGVNTVSFTPDGRLLAATLAFSGAILYEIDPAGIAPPKVWMAPRA